MTNQVLREEEDRIGFVLYTVDFSLFQLRLKKKRKKKRKKRKRKKPEELRFESSPGCNIIIFPLLRLREKWLKSFSKWQKRF